MHLTANVFYTYYVLMIKFFPPSSSRCAEALKLFLPGSSQRCPIMDMIEFLPDTYKVLIGVESNITHTLFIISSAS